MADIEGGLGGRRPLSRDQIARRTVSREEVAMWLSETKREDVTYAHYWESKEVIQVSEVGDEYIVFVGRNEVITAKVWTFLDHTLPHSAYILRPNKETRYSFSEKEGIMLRFQFVGGVRIFNKNGLTAVIDEPELSVFQKADDVIIRVDRAKEL
ncbi:MAG: hypothetical protein IK115_10090 [Lachnospiraceae bacterium]|nr:hypothetical protein [Lachnospiraceae bacterium]